MFRPSGLFLRIEINVLLYHVCVCHSCLYDFINSEQVHGENIPQNCRDIYQNDSRMMNTRCYEGKQTQCIFFKKKIHNVVERLRKITNKLRTAGHNCKIEITAVNRHKQHSLFNEYQLDCNLYTKQKNFLILNFLESRRYFSLH